MSKAMKSQHLAMCLCSLFVGLITLIAAGQAAIAAEPTAKPPAKAITQQPTKAAPPIIYDEATDHLSVKVKDASLLEVLAKISILSGVQILVAPKVEQPITLEFKDRTVEDGLKQIVQAYNLNHAAFYNEEVKKDGSKKVMLTGMQIIGKDKDAELKPVVALEHEATVRALSRISTSKDGKPKKTASMIDYAQQRWQARLSALSPEQRKKLEEDAQRRAEKAEAERIKREARRAEREKRDAERRARRQAEEELMKATDPERYQLKEQRREELRQQVTEELQQEQTK